MAALVLGLAIAPASAQAALGEDRANNCTATLSGQEGENMFDFTIVCADAAINQAQFNTNEGAVIAAFDGEEGGGLTCNVVGTSFTCVGELDEDEVGTAQPAQTMDPCGNEFTIEDLVLTKEGGGTAEFEDIRIECTGGGGGGGNNGGNNGGNQGDQYGTGDDGNQDGGRRFTAADDEYTPKGGIDSGSGGQDAGPAPSTPLTLAAGGFLMIGTLGGGIALRRRLSS